MKTFFLKLFLALAALVCVSEGIAFVTVGAGRLEPGKLLSLYVQLVQNPGAMTATLNAGLCFVLTGLILLFIASRAKPAPVMIEIEKDGKILTVPLAIMKDFISQILEQNPYVRDLTISLEHKRKGRATGIHLSCALDGAPSIHEEINRIEDTLKNEIENVFAWKEFNFSFQLRGVGLDPEKKYFSSPDADAQDAQRENPEHADEPEESEDEPPVSKFHSRGRNRPKDKSLFSKMLWGK